MKNAILVLRNHHQACDGPRSFAEDQHPLFRPAEFQFGLMDGLLIVAFLAAFVGLVLLLAQ